MNELVLLLGAKGGVGTTAVVVSEARRSPSGTCVTVDLDLVHGDLAHRLGVAVTTTIADLAPVCRDHVTPSHLAAITYRDAAGVGVVPSPARAELSELVTPAAVTALLTAMLATSRVLVDAGSRVDATILAAMRLATTIVLVARPDDVCHTQLVHLHDLIRRAGVTCDVRLCLPRSRARRAAAMAMSLGVALWEPANARSIFGGAGGRFRAVSRRVPAAGPQVVSRHG